VPILIDLKGIQDRCQTRNAYRSWGDNMLQYLFGSRSWFWRWEIMYLGRCSWRWRQRDIE